MSQNIKDDIYRSWHAINPAKYLRDVARDDPKTYLSFVSKLVPAELQITGSVLIDIGHAMQQAEQRLQAPDSAPIIDVTPNEPESG